MKRFSLLALLALLLSGSAGAATISGTISSKATCNPLSGQKVYIEDSLTNWLDSTITNSAGHYSFTIPSTIATSSWLVLSTNSCGAPWRIQVLWEGVNARTNIITCGFPTYLNGSIFLGTTSVQTRAIVYLIRQDVNPSTLDTTLTAVDSTFANGFGYLFMLPCAPTGTFLLKAALLPGHSNYASYLPTYYGNALNWNSGTVLPSAPFTTLFSIDLIAGTNLGGPAFVGGSVVLGANKATAIGDPLSRRLLIITKSTGEAVAYTYSNAAGKFQFPSLPYGTYRIFGDAMGKANPKLSVTVSAAQPTINNIIFEENDSKFEGKFGTLGVAGSNPVLSAISVYPNPVNDFVNVKGLSAISGNKTVILSNVTGTVISSEVTAQGEVSIPTKNLAPGVYMLQIGTEAGNASFRIVK